MQAISIASTALERADCGFLDDKLVAFNGELQLRWAEAGLQKGGGYRGTGGSGCGLPAPRFDSHSITVLSQIPSYEALRCHAIQGTYGRTPEKTHS